MDDVELSETPTAPTVTDESAAGVTAAGVTAADAKTAPAPAPVPDLEKAQGSASAPLTGWRAKAARFDRWIILTIASLGATLAAVQSSALVIAFPTLLIDLRADIQTILWVLLSFMLVVASIVPVVGKLGDILGQAVLFNYGFAIFTLASFLAGFSQESVHGEDLIFYRVIMGIGATFLFTNSAAIVTNAFAPYNQVGLAQGVFQLAFATGSVLGPVIGGAFAVTNWRWIFWYNAPIAFVCTVLAFLLVRDSEAITKARLAKNKSWQQHLRDFDWLGSTMIMAAILLLMLAMTQAVAPTAGLTSTAAIVCLVVFGVVALVLFIVAEFYAREPVIPHSIWRNRTFTASTLAALLMSFTRGNVTYAMIFFLQGPYGEDPLTAGIQLIPLGLGIVVMGMPAGKLADKLGVRLLAVVGTLIVVAGLFGLAFVNRYTNYWLIAFALFVIGIGQGFFNAPNALAGMLSVKPNERGVAAAVRLLVSFIASMVGIVMVFALILNSLTYQELIILFIYGGGGLSDDAINSFTKAYQTVFWITIAMTFAATIFSAMVPSSFKPAAAVRADVKGKAGAHTDTKPAESDATSVPLQSGESRAVLTGLPGTEESSVTLDMRPSQAILAGLPTQDAEMAIIGKAAA